MLPSSLPQPAHSSALTKHSFRIPGSVKEIENQDGAVLLDIEQGVCFSLTPVAARIWQLLKARNEPEQIADAIAVEFTAPRDMVERDLTEFLDSLRQHKLLFDGNDDHGDRGFRSWLRRTFSRPRA